MVRNYRIFSKTFSTPRRPHEKERIDRELEVCGKYGLRCKREVWRYQYLLSKIRKSARDLLTLPENHEKRLIEGQALLRRMHRYGILEEKKNKLDYILSLKIEDFLERRLQTLIWKSGLAKSVHHARVLIFQRHIRVGKQIVTIPSFMVRTDSEKHISFASNSSLNKNSGRLGRIKKKKARGGDKKEEKKEEKKPEAKKEETKKEEPKKEEKKKK
eukprot:EC824329.1.p1 GENE.EC824329.1~~EC824329.1.p1  ORF type:complete len:215 (+),score=110.36 EC824329.1:27-671(+)